MTEAIRYRVLHMRRRSQGAGAAGWSAAADTDLLLPLEVRDLVAPRHATARLAFNEAAAPGAAGDHVWNWRNYAGTDDIVAIVSDHPEPAHRQVLFVGFLADADWKFDRSESLVLTAVGRSFRFRDQSYLVYGRWMASSAGPVTLYTGLPASFNAGGRPNRAADRVAVPGGPPGAPGRGVAVFADDGAPAAEFWTFTDAAEYLMWRYNAAAAWLTNHVFDDGIAATREATGDWGDYNAEVDPIVQVDVDGLDLWTALAAAADHGRYDVSCQHAMGVGAAERIGSRIFLGRRDTGLLLDVAHQPPLPDGDHSPIDLQETNLFAADISEATASCVTAPVVAGGRELIEITVELQKAWSPGDLDIGSDPVVREGAAEADPTNQYVKRYVRGGSDFASYAEVGRLWDANSDGYFSDSLGLTVTDVAALAGGDAGSWPVMSFSPRRLLTRIAAGPVSAGIPYLIEYTLDAGTNWHVLKGAKLLEGRLGVYISRANMAAIVPPGTAPDAASYIDELLSTPANVGVRLTCTIESPVRTIAAPARRLSAGTAFAQSAFIDRSARAQTRARAASSIFHASGISADTADGSTAAAAMAAVIQDLNEDRLIEASLPIEWPSTEVRLGDRVARIGGIDVELRTNCGASASYPRVVGRVWLLTPQTYQTFLLLDTERKAAVL